MSAIEIVGLEKSFGAIHAVRDCSLRISPGEFVAVLGPSGCGKTTLLRLIGGFLTADRGSIVINGRDVAGLPPFRRHIGFVFQSYALFPHLSVANNLAFGLKMRGKYKAGGAERVRRCLELVRLPETADRMPHQLSGGQQQRVALARALVIEPDLLLLDEPLGALDRKLREAMQVELKSLQQSVGVTTLLVTHDQDEALTMADRIVVMNEGRIEQVGTPSEIYEAPRTRFVADFIGMSNFLTGTLRRGAAGAMQFHTAGGLQLTVLEPAGEAASNGCILMVRPEKITLRTTILPDDHPNQFTGKITGVVYHGDLTRLKIGLGTEVLTVTSANGGPTQRQRDWSVGQPVFVAIDPKCICLISARD